MKKQTAFPAASAAPVSSAEAFAPSDPDTITIEALDASESPIQLEVPYNPEKLAVMDLAALDILDNLDLGDRVVGASTTSIDYLSSYQDTAANLGNIKEADLEAVAACEPDLIFIGGRLASSYDALSEIAPVVLLTTDSSLGVVASTEKNAKTIASIFGLEDQVDSLMSDYQSRIDALKTVAEGQSAIIGMCTSGSFNIIGNGGRLSLIVNEVGFTNAGEGYATQRGASSDSSSSDSNPHGTESSFELLPELNPDWIFVMDRDSAIGTNGAKLAADIMDNEIVNSSSAAKEGHLVILEHPAVWYTAEGGITALGIMISDLEAAMLS